METGFPGPIRCCGWTSTGADYGVRQGTTQKKEKTPLTWDSQHVHQDIQTVPRLEGKSNHVTRSSNLPHTPPASPSQTLSPTQPALHQLSHTTGKQGCHSSSLSLLP